MLNLGGEIAPSLEAQVDYIFCSHGCFPVNMIMVSWKMESWKMCGVFSLSPNGLFSTTSMIMEGRVQLYYPP